MSPRLRAFNPKAATARPSAVAQLVAKRLQESSYPVLRRLSCDDHEGVITLRGCVTSYHLKQVAQTIAGKVEGVEEIVNRLEVVEPQDYLRYAASHRIPARAISRPR